METPTLKDYLKEKREEKKWNAKFVSTKCKIKYSTLKAIEYGKIKSPNLTILTALSKAYDCNLKDLMKLSNYPDNLLPKYRQYEIKIDNELEYKAVKAFLKYFRQVAVEEKRKKSGFNLLRNEYGI
jgi:transcriptional regulator with XRE-family HTH domain